MLYYIFETEQLALDAENYIAQLGGAPLTGVCAQTGELQPNKCQTTRWAVPQQRLDGKWVFPFIGKERIAQFPGSVVDYFTENFPHTHEEFNQNWFPEIDEEV